MSSKINQCRGRDVRTLVEKAILKSRIPDAEVSKDDLLAVFHLLETETFWFETTKKGDLGMVSKKLNALCHSLKNLDS